MWPVTGFNAGHKKLSTMPWVTDNEPITSTDSVEYIVGPYHGKNKPAIEYFITTEIVAIATH